jgi:membrane protein
MEGIVKWRLAWSVLKGALQEFNTDKVLRLSAAVAYYSIFSIGPILAIAVGVAGLAFGHETVRHQIQQQLNSLLGESSAKIVSSMMGSQKHGSSLLTTLVGVVALLIGAGGVFGQLQDSLNTIWEVKPKPGASVWSFIRSRFLSFSMVLGVGFLLLVSMALTTFLSAITTSLGTGLPHWLLQTLNVVVSFAVITLLFAMIFKYLPDIKVPFRKVWIGAIATTLLFSIGKFLLALYLGRESTASSYGAAGSVILILMWVYYASIILFFGAEVTQVYARQTGTHLIPATHAEPVTPQDRAEEGIPKDQPSRAAGALKPAQAAVRARAPGAVVKERPWQFVGLMMAAGFVGATALRFRALRRAIKIYGSFRRV